MKPIVSSLHHVSLLVADTRRALGFYQGILGLRPSDKRPDLGFPGAWFELGHGQQIHLLQLPDPDRGRERPEHGGRDRHLAFMVSDLNALQAALEAAGVPYTRSGSGRRAIFCRDPDGNALEFIEEDSGQEPVRV